MHAQSSVYQVLLTRCKMFDGKYDTTNGKEFLDEINAVCNKYGVYAMMTLFVPETKGSKSLGYRLDKKSGIYVPVFQTNVN